MPTTIRVSPPDPRTGRVMLVIETIKGPLTNASFIPVDFDQKVPLIFTLNGHPVESAFHIMPTPEV